MTSLNDETTIRRFLLGGGSQNERELIEERLFTDEEFFVLVDAIEDELIDEYIHGKLQPHEVEGFEQVFLITADRAERFEFARALQYSISPQVSSGSVWKREERKPATLGFWARTFRRPALALTFALGAFMLITIAILLFENYRSNRQELATQPTTPSPSPDGDRVQQAATNDGNGNASVKEDGRTEPNLKQLHYEGRPVNKPRISQRPREGIAGVAQFAIVLTSGAMRGEGDSIKQFTIPARTKRVRFGLVVEDEVAAAPQLLEVELQNGDGLVLLRFSKPDFSLSRNGRRLNLEISKDRLTAGDYQIVLRASASDSTSEISTRYYFRVRDTYGLKRPN